MSEEEIDLRNCPNCLVDAIIVEEGTKPDAMVECNNCHVSFQLKDLD